ncbi:MAG: hypothetical protein M1826_002978 [Phylliscum demangeonii]|nr:MAG: hypothetical protein M1826_002978 [Phylliscum demangeonii]
MAERLTSLDAEAKDQGFSSYAEKEEQEEARSLELGRLSDITREKKARELGLTRAQYEAELAANDPQQRSPMPWVLEPVRTICTHGCEDHAIPSFCAASLVDYRSQELPDEMAQLISRHQPLLEKVNMRLDRQATGMSSVAHKARWECKSRERPMELPNWAYGDPVLQQIMPADLLAAAIHPVGYHCPSVARSSISTTPTKDSPNTVIAKANAAFGALGPDWLNRRMVLANRRESKLVKGSEEELSA